MPSRTLTFTLDNFCASLTHGDLTVFEEAVRAFKKQIHWEEAKQPLDNNELKTSVYVLVRELARRSGATTKQQVNAVIPQISITLTYPVL